jgi:AMMECR1 domain-containing protein
MRVLLPMGLLEFLNTICSKAGSIPEVSQDGDKHSEVFIASILGAMLRYVAEH